MEKIIRMALSSLRSCLSLSKKFTLILILSSCSLALYGSDFNFNVVDSLVTDVNLSFNEFKKQNEFAAEYFQSDFIIYIESIDGRFIEMIIPLDEQSAEQELKALCFTSNSPEPQIKKDSLSKVPLLISLSNKIEKKLTKKEIDQIHISFNADNKHQTSWYYTSIYRKKSYIYTKIYESELF